MAPQARSRKPDVRSSAAPGQSARGLQELVAQPQADAPRRQCARPVRNVQRREDVLPAVRDGRALAGSFSRTGRPQRRHAAVRHADP